MMASTSEPEVTTTLMGSHQQHEYHHHQNQQPVVGVAAVAPPLNGILTFDDVSKFFSLPIAEAANNLGVCTSVLKRICRENGIIRWPYRKYLAGKTVEDIKKDAARERTKDLAELSKEAKRIDVSKMMPSTTVGPSSSFGNQVQSGAPSLGQETSKLQRGVPMQGNVLQQQGNKHFQNGRPSMLHFNQTRSIPTYLDEFKYGFPANGLSPAFTKWWGSSSKKGTERTLQGESADAEEENQQSFDLSNETSRCTMIDEGSSIVSQPSALLYSQRKAAVEYGRESLKLGISKGCEHYKLGKRQRSILLQVFKSSLPDQWKDSFS